MYLLLLCIHAVTPNRSATMLQSLYALIRWINMLPLIYCRIVIIYVLFDLRSFGLEKICVNVTNLFPIVFYDSKVVCSMVGIFKTVLQSVHTDSVHALLYRVFHNHAVRVYCHDIHTKVFYMYISCSIRIFRSSYEYYLYLFLQYIFSCAHIQ